MNEEFFTELQDLSYRNLQLVFYLRHEYGKYIKKYSNFKTEREFFVFLLHQNN